MGSLERNSPAGLRVAEPGRMRHGAGESLPRHLHDHAFAAVVLAGGYTEAGDTGRHRVTAGEVVLHQAWEGHLDRFDDRGAEVLVLQVGDRDARQVRGRVPDPDAIARVAERDRVAAAQLMLAELEPSAIAAADWPDLLAQALHDDPGLSLSAWAEAHAMHGGSLSRGFRQVFGLTPARFRLIQRTRRAIMAVRTTADPLCGIAQDCGFADQAHMTRAISGLVRMTPLTLRRTV